MEQLRISITRPPSGWPVLLDMEAGGYDSPLCVVCSVRELSWRTAEIGPRMGRLIHSWIEAGALSLEGELSHQTALSDAHRGQG